jgi:hypothetical protein
MMHGSGLRFGAIVGLVSMDQRQILTDNSTRGVVCWFVDVSWTGKVGESTTMMKLVVVWKGMRD